MMAGLRVFLLVAWFFGASTAPAADKIRATPPAPQSGGGQTIWDTAELFTAPTTFPAEEFEASGESGNRIWPVFFESVPYRGKPTRVFAWVGMPAEPAEKRPGMVLVHGGGGTAFRSWLQTWVNRGYAAITMDTSGAVPASARRGETRRRRNQWGGPDGWGGFVQVDEPVGDQWMYHAVAAVIRGHSLFRTVDGIDPDRIGLTGISWGGVISEIVAGIDRRFRFVVPVYGSGFLGENSYWKSRDLREIGPERATKWLTLWDPSHYIGSAAMPALFCNGTNDKFFPPDSWQKTYRAKPGDRTLSLKVRMYHSHAPAGDPPEIAMYADAAFRQGEPLPRFVEQGQDGDRGWAVYASSVAIVKAELIYTCDRGEWVKRHWETTSAAIDWSSNRIVARVPGDATAFYFNITDTRGCIVSTEHETVEQ